MDLKMEFDPSKYVEVIQRSVDSSLRLAGEWLPPPGREQQDILLAGAGLGLALVLGLAAIFMYRRVKLRKEAAKDPAPTTTANATIPKPKIKTDQKPVPVLDQPKPKPWKKISGVKAVNNSGEVSGENLPRRSESKTQKVLETKEKVPTNPDEMLNVRKKTITPSPSTGWKKEPNQVKFEKTESAVEIASKKIPEEPRRAPVKRIVRPEIDEEKEALKFAEELREAERKAEEEAKKQLRPIHLNIDSQARSKDDVERSSVREMDLVRKLCGEMREIAKTSNPEEREERQKEIEKVRSAR